MANILNITLLVIGLAAYPCSVIKLSWGFLAPLQQWVGKLDIHMESESMVFITLQVSVKTLCGQVDKA